MTKSLLHRRSLLRSCTSEILIGLLLMSATTFSQVEFPRSAQKCFELGEALLEKHEWQPALEAFDASIRQDAYFADAYYARGLVREHFAQWQEALTDYNIYLEWRPDHTEALFNRAQLRYRLELFELAKADFKKLMGLPRGETTTVYFRVNAFSGETNQIFTAQGANQAYLHNYLGLTETQLKNFSEALVCFDSAIRVVSDDPDLWVNRGAVYEKLDSLHLAISDYEKALSLNPDHALAKHNLGVLKMKTSDHAESMKLLNEAIDANPRLPYAYAERGYARMQRGDYAGALQDYNQALAIDATAIDYLLNRGWVLEKLNKPLDAYRDFSRAIELDNRFEKAWLNRGNVLAKLGRLHEAVEDYSVALVQRPNYAEAYYNRAVAYHRMGRKENACADVRQAEALSMAVSPRLKKQACGN